jgi:hypothetical protein
MATKKPQPKKPTAKPGARAKAAATPGRPPSAPGNPPNNPIELPDGMWERIARKAYDLWEQRGRRTGHDFEDWLDAETQVMEEIHEARQ